MNQIITWIFLGILAVFFNVFEANQHGWDEYCNVSTKNFHTALVCSQRTFHNKTAPAENLTCMNATIKDVTSIYIGIKNKTKGICENSATRVSGNPHLCCKHEDGDFLFNAECLTRQQNDKRKYDEFTKSVHECIGHETCRVNDTILPAKNNILINRDYSSYLIVEYICSADSRGTFNDDDDDDDDDDDEALPITTFIFVAVAAILILGIVVVLIFCLRNKRKQEQPKLVNLEENVETIALTTSDGRHQTISTTDSKTVSGSNSHSQSRQKTNERNRNDDAQDRKSRLKVSPENTSNQVTLNEGVGQYDEIEIAEVNGRVSLADTSLDHTGVDNTYDRTGTDKTYDRTGTDNTYDHTGTDNTYDHTGTDSTYDRTGTDNTYDRTGTDSTYDRTGTDNTYDHTGTDNTYDHTGTDNTYDRSGAHNTYDRNGTDNTYDHTGTDNTYDHTGTDTTYECS